MSSGAGPPQGQLQPFLPFLLSSPRMEQLVSPPSPPLALNLNKVKAGVLALSCNPCLLTLASLGTRGHEPPRSWSCWGMHLCLQRKSLQ